MKYKVKNLIKDGDVWKCILEYWHNCYCNHQKKEVVIYQEQRPTKLEIINAFNG